MNTGKNKHLCPKEAQALHTAVSSRQQNSNELSRS